MNHKYILLITTVITALFALGNTSAQKQKDRPVCKPMSFEVWNKLKQNKKQTGSTSDGYKLIQVKVLPPVDLMRISDKDLMAYLQGKILICCEEKREVYISHPKNRADFYTKKADFYGRLERTEKIERERKGIILNTPEACQKDSLLSVQVRERLNYVKTEFGEPWYTIAIRRINSIFQE